MIDESDVSLTAETRECEHEFVSFSIKIMILRILVIFYLVLHTLSFDGDDESESFGGSCEVDSLAVYKVTLEGRWSREIFPKHYPETRPRAHFSKTFGLTHNQNFTFFKVGELVSDEMKAFCKSADSEPLENDEKFEQEIFDEFIIPKLENPIDKVESRLFVQSNYSLISMVTKLIPSPDWFIGVESLQVSFLLLNQSARSSALLSVISSLITAVQR